MAKALCCGKELKEWDEDDGPVQIDEEDTDDPLLAAIAAANPLYMCEYCSTSSEEGYKTAIAKAHLVWSAIRDGQDV